ncbi:hypothetical protein RND81_05G149400 [Saponaria officinalis]|uniref:Bifunctional inhibitor/plant lipid transfer protein/seed storage helical domain-containing protein n=1 Tax=Saponaria officinalis TaxID=3572 RepID=A0AAW1L169_SAPOF
MAKLVRNTTLVALAMAFMMINHYSSDAQITQITSIPCTSSMLSSFTPCINYLTSSSATGTSPTSDCCGSLRSLMSNGTGCLCQIVTGGVPFRIPFNRTLALKLPKVCKQPGVPVQCKASPGAPIPAPGPTAAFSPSASPAALGPTSSGSANPAIEGPALAPVSDTTPTSDGSVPTTSATLTPSSAIPSLSVSPLVFLLCSAAAMMKFL